MNQSLTIDNEQATVGVITKGGCITSYRLKTNDGFFDVLKSFGQRNKASFPLIPYSNRIKNGCFVFEGKKYQLPLNFGDHPHSIHGVGWQEEWSVKNHEEDSITLELTHDGTVWPFPFKATQTVKLSGADLYNEIQLTNLSTTSMPAGLGMHPYFPRHGTAILTADVGEVWKTDDTCLPLEKISCPPNWNLTSGAMVDELHCDNQFDPWTGTALINWPDKSASVTLTSSEDLNRLVVYAPRDEEFFCIEPTSHITDAFNFAFQGRPQQETGIRILEPEETWTVWMELLPKHHL
ncbi:aldose 1-epimerase [Kiloniella sp.]|uniref:aldose 1-epimerase n=1 Tax=Kiloniella sp. TaxID=1938587 RepID=UPI003B01D8D3